MKHPHGRCSTPVAPSRSMAYLHLVFPPLCLAIFQNEHPAIDPPFRKRESPLLSGRQISAFRGPDQHSCPLLRDEGRRSWWLLIPLHAEMSVCACEVAIKKWLIIAGTVANTWMHEILIHGFVGFSFFPTFGSLGTGDARREPRSPERSTHVRNSRGYSSPRTSPAGCPARPRREVQRKPGC